MARKANRNYYGHDDRTSGSNVIRKVSFMNTGGRVRKNKRNDQFIRYIADDDVVMGGSESSNWKNNNPRQKKNFRRRPGSPGVRGSYVPKPLGPNSWYQVKILFGAKFEKRQILQKILTHISPVVFIPNSYSTNGKDVIFYVDDLSVANTLRGVSKKIYFPDGFLMEIRVREGAPPPVQVDDKLKEKLKLVMAKRYVAENKALDLTKFSSDPDLLGDVHCPLSRLAIQKVVFQIITENISDLVALNLSDNRIHSFDDSLSIDIKKLKNLKILYLADNKIKSINALNCFKSCEVTELVLRQNPVVHIYKDNAHYVRYESGVTEIRKKFPSLLKLDDLELPPVISFDVSDEAKLPTPQAAFMCNLEGRDIVKAFLSQYFAIYDSDNRLELAQAYHDNSTFSLCAVYPPNQKSNTNRLNIYIQNSRNLFRVPDYPRRKSRLQMGKEKIVQFLMQLPKSQHDLSSFAVDLTLFTPTLINLSVTGVFREPNISGIAITWPVRHFSRTFLIVPVGQGFCIINDMLCVTNATDSEIQNSFKENENASILQSPTQAPLGVMGASSPGGGIQMDETVRLQMVQTLATRTGMNLEWSKKCLDETQWDFDRAVWTFTELQSKGSVPAEAFFK